jgi:hypothetical protein
MDCSQFQPEISAQPYKRKPAAATQQDFWGRLFINKRNTGKECD